MAVLVPAVSVIGDADGVANARASGSDGPGPDETFSLAGLVNLGRRRKTVDETRSWCSPQTIYSLNFVSFVWCT